MQTFDKALELRNLADGAETSSQNETMKALDVCHIGDFEVVIDITAIDAASSNETYVVKVDVDTAVAAGSRVTVASRTVARTITVPHRIRIPLNSSECALLEPAAAAIGVGCTLGGTSPSLTYGAFVAPTAKNAAAIADRA